MKSKTKQMELLIDEPILEILPKEIGDPGLLEFPDKLIKYTRKVFNNLKGNITAISYDDENQILSLEWQQEESDEELFAHVVSILNKGEYSEAILLLELLLSQDSQNVDYLCNIGMAYSDLGILGKAIGILKFLLDVEPNHVNGRVALGVAYNRAGKDNKAISQFREATAIDPENPWANRNLGGALLNEGNYEEATGYLEKATNNNPNDLRAWYGLAQAYEKSGKLDKADNAYRRILEIDEFDEIAELARQGLSRIAQLSFRSATPGMERMDAVMYCLGALEKFEKMPNDKIQQIGFEIAILGTKGIDINNPEPKYRLKSLSGTFSGLHLLCLEYVAFKIFAPEQDIGFDLSTEYRAAKSLLNKKQDR